ncbi:hypothetical protein SDC9_106561 [bioreactor metagenome]|uniref:Uncharacterized protein n=1 Tax=bioreactor metagenome TaxID=1076179 RepID=A0A645B2S0_9ZZZZ
MFEIVFGIAMISKFGHLSNTPADIDCKLVGRMTFAKLSQTKNAYSSIRFTVLGNVISLR